MWLYRLWVMGMGHIAVCTCGLQWIKLLLASHAYSLYRLYSDFSLLNIFQANISIQESTSYFETIEKMKNSLVICSTSSTDISTLLTTFLILVWTSDLQRWQWQNSKCATSYGSSWKSPRATAYVTAGTMGKPLDRERENQKWIPVWHPGSLQRLLQLQLYILVY